MTVFFCLEDGGFYPGEPYGDAVGKPCVELTDVQYLALRREIDAGKSIAVIDGWPHAVVPVMDADQTIAFERGWRDAELNRNEWLRNRHRDQLDLGIATTLSNEQFTELLTYLQALRDWPVAGSFPDPQQRPAPPDWIDQYTQ